MSTEKQSGSYLDKWTKLCLDDYKDILARKNEFVEDYSSETELKSVKEALEDEGYQFRDGDGLRPVDLSEDPGIEIPYFGDLKLPSNLQEGVCKMVETVSPFRDSVYRIGIVESNGDLYATTRKDYETLQEVSEKTLDP